MDAQKDSIMPIFEVSPQPVALFRCVLLTSTGIARHGHEPAIYRRHVSVPCRKRMAPKL